DLRSLTTEPRSSPALASSAAGLTMAGSGKSSSILPCATVQRGMGSPACWSNAFAMGLRRHAARVQRLAPVMGIPANSSVPTTCSSHSLFPWTPSHRLNTRSARRATWNQRMSWRTPTLRISWPIEAKIAPISSTAFITPRMSSGVQSSAPGSNRMTTFTRPPPPAAGHPSRSGHELLLPEGGARRRVRLRRAHPGSGPHRLAPADGTGADGRRGDPPRGTGPAAGGGGRVKVVILFDPGAEDWTPEDIRGVMKAVDEIGAIFASMGHEIRKVGVRHDMRWFQVARRADLVFNLCEGVHGKSEWEEHVVGTLEFAG